MCDVKQNEFYQKPSNKIRDQLRARARAQTKMKKEEKRSAEKLRALIIITIAIDIDRDIFPYISVQSLTFNTLVCTTFIIVTRNDNIVKEQFALERENQK